MARNPENPEKLTRAQALELARKLIAFYVEHLGLPHPGSLPCHECSGVRDFFGRPAGRKAKEYAMYVLPVCESCKRNLAFSLGDIKAIAHHSPKLQKALAEKIQRLPFGGEPKLETPPLLSARNEVKELSTPILNVEYVD